MTQRVEDRPDVIRAMVRYQRWSLPTAAAILLGGTALSVALLAGQVALMEMSDRLEWLHRAPLIVFLAFLVLIPIILASLLTALVGQNVIRRRIRGLARDLSAGDIPDAIMSAYHVSPEEYAFRAVSSGKVREIAEAFRESDAEEKAVRAFLSA